MKEAGGGERGTGVGHKWGGGVVVVAARILEVEVVATTVMVVMEDGVGAGDGDRDMEQVVVEEEEEEANYQKILIQTQLRIKTTFQQVVKHMSIIVELSLFPISYEQK
ncbi:hypothetical protein Salat_2563100 [Sesamum alatum]|uniref:Uncharacterized protein n=1 Tax=Sesamum alatum TaxID=300844 RepID=A0AAE1XSP5_9LAMI|nr:hypothetical protein Salat_2563100 [Sesamum alatum]